MNPSPLVSFYEVLLASRGLKQQFSATDFYCMPMYLNSMMSTDISVNILNHRDLQVYIWHKK